MLTLNTDVDCERSYLNVKIGLFCAHIIAPYYLYLKIKTNLEMSIRRSRLELHADILGAIQGGVNKPTRIMYTTGLAWISLTQLLQSLEDQGLVEVSYSSGSDKIGRKTYRVTEKGARFLAYFNQVKDLMESEISSGILDA